MSPLEQLAVYVVLGAIVAAILWLAWKLCTRTQQGADADAAKLGREQLRKAVAAGTHDEQGCPLCRICGDRNKPETRATKHGYQIDRSEGFWAWLRQMVGAPARLRVGRRLFDDYCYCRECAIVAEHELLAYLLAYEQQRRDWIRDAEVELRRFERAGLDERVRARVTAHDREQLRAASRPPATVVPFKAAGG